MLMGSNDGAIDIMNVPVESTFGIGLLLDGLQEMLPDAGFSPAIEAARHGTPRPKALGQIPPGGTPTQYPQDATDDASMVQRRSSGLRFLRRKQRFDPLPLRVGQFFSFHIDECTRPVRVCKHALVHTWAKVLKAASTSLAVLACSIGMCCPTALAASPRISREGISIRILWIDKHSYNRSMEHQLTQQFQSLCLQSEIY